MSLAKYALEASTDQGGPERINFFQANSLSDAQTTAQSFSTMFQLKVVLVPIGTVGPYTTYVPGSQGGTVTLPTLVTGY